MGLSVFGSLEQLCQYGGLWPHVAVENLKWELTCAFSIQLAPSSADSAPLSAAAECHPS